MKTCLASTASARRMGAASMGGRQVAVRNLQRFIKWIEDRDSSNDWQDYIRQGKLNRSELAKECRFALSVVRQNPAIKAALAALEERLRANGVLMSLKTDPIKSSEDRDHDAAYAVERRMMAAKSKSEQRVKVLEEQNAALKAELRDLRGQLARYKHLDDHLSCTGRLLQS
jgi:hypothetical protein